MEQMILQFIATYGWKLALIACSGIFVLGIFKFFNVFEKIEKSQRKYLYAGISAGISIIASAIYLLAIDGFNVAGFGVIAGSIYGINQAIYALYENTGFRTALRTLGNLFINFVAKKQLNQAKQDIIDDMAENKNVENIKA